MDRQEVKQILAKQLQLLSEKSKNALPGELMELTTAMIALASIL